ncbi:MAG: transposase [Deltaproteobacteria bacterium]|nr:transposase [Deltaproteobacteria bacterium]
MGRPRKRHLQQLLHFGDKNGQRRGNPNKRRRTPGVKLGRPPKGPRSSERHKVRPQLKSTQPVLVTLRVSDEITRIRTRDAYQAVRWATIAVAERMSFRIVHISIQHNHVHLIVEADDRMALARGMQAFEISAARRINAAISKGRTKDLSWWDARARGDGARDDRARDDRARDEGARWWNAKTRCWVAGRRKGSVFPDRYNLQVLTTPRQVRNALCYVLNNWRKHREDERDYAASWLIDPFSSGWAFGGWEERGDSPFAWKTRETYEPMLTAYPQTWLLRDGWRRGGGRISVYDVPSARKATARA